MARIDDLEAAVERQTTVSASLRALFDTIAEELKQAGLDAARVDAVIAKAKADADADEARVLAKGTIYLTTDHRNP